MSSPGAVTFSFAQWQARYPELSGVTSAQAQLYFNEATLFCQNTLNVVNDPTTLLLLLNMLTAHIAALDDASTAAGSNPLTPPGRVNSASEGSVSAQFDASSGASPSRDWYYQTKYGARYWQASLPYRLTIYRPRTGFRGSPSWPGRFPWRG